MPLDLPLPDPAKLNNHFILGEIIDNVDVLSDDFPHVDLPELINQLTQVRNKQLDPEVQVRGFLKVFQQTPIFKDGYDKLDKTTKSQLNEFIGGKSAKQVVGTKSFAIPPSPAAKHHFHFLDFFKKLRTKRELAEHLAKDPTALDLPVIYENDARTELMQVCSL